MTESTKSKLQLKHILRAICLLIVLVAMGLSLQNSVVHPQTSTTLVLNINADSDAPVSDSFDEAVYNVLRPPDLWVDAINGDDKNAGLTTNTAFRTIQRAADIAGPGTTVHILPGIYRESVKPLLSGIATEPVIYMAEKGSGTVVIRGSVASSSLLWTQMMTDTIGLPPGVEPRNIFFTNLSAWNLDGSPRFVVEFDEKGQVINRLPLAREPDWQVATEWKHHEYWWAADGGSSPARCNPATDHDINCDQATRSTTQLTDRTNDPEPAGVEVGNLTTLGDLSGATLVALDTIEGHYVYRRTITAHNIAAGRITVDKVAEFDYGSNKPGLGWGSKYYVEGKPYLLDTAGEWWYDYSSRRLYLWPLKSVNPGSTNIEISNRENGFNLGNISYIILKDLTIELFNGSAVYQVNKETDKSNGNSLRNLNLRYADVGVELWQKMTSDSPVANVIDSFTLEDSEVAYMDTYGISINSQWDNSNDPDLFTHSGVRNITIRNNELHHLGFRSDHDNAIGLPFTFADRLTFVNNYVHNIAHNGVQFLRSVIQSPNERGFKPSEVKTGDILVKDNVFERACQLTTDCGGLKIWGSSPDGHVFRNLLVTGNIFRNNFGWSYVAEKRQRWLGGDSSNVKGMGGFGLYLDSVSGIHIYRNVAYNNTYAGYFVVEHWGDSDLVLANNVAANSIYGMELIGGDNDTEDILNTQMINNILASNEGSGLTLSYSEGHYDNMIVDNNLYFNNGWRTTEPGGISKAGVLSVREKGIHEQYATLVDVRANTPWEAHGIEGNPSFWNYDPQEHDLRNDAWPDFHLTSDSTSVFNLGTQTLPSSLIMLLDAFGIFDDRIGPAYDIGRYEDGFRIRATPSTQVIYPGETVDYTLGLYPSDTPYVITLRSTTPSPNLTVNITPATITGGQTAVLSISNPIPGALIPGELYTISISGLGSGFSDTINLELAIGRTRIYLPIFR